METHFVGEPIEVGFDHPPLFSKSPDCPQRIIWRAETLTVTELVTEWRDYGRRGRRANNMRPERLARARLTGSWGVGRFYFHVQIADGREMVIYYDRAPNGQQRAGSWHLERLLLPVG